MFELILFRTIQGIGGGILISLPFIVVGEIFGNRDTAKYMGLLSAVFGFANVLGPILGGVITDTLGWRWVFFCKCSNWNYCCNHDSVFFTQFQTTRC